MNTLGRIAFVVLCSFLPTALLADGLIYQLPEDGTWARFQTESTYELPRGKVETMTGTVTLSSVGVAKVDGEACRWIEIGEESKRNDKPNTAFTAFQKLLIPEKHLGRGQDPLADVRKLWLMQSQVANGTPKEIQDLKGTGRVQLDSLHPSLHGPVKNSKPLDKLVVESKLGKLECEGVTAQEIIKLRGNVSADTTYTIRLHRTAPFGVVAFEVTSKFLLDGKVESTVTSKMKLVDFGKDAKSAMPDSK